MVIASVSASAEQATPEDMVNSLFDAMRAGNGAAIREMVVADARLDRLRPDGTLQQGTFERWISWVDEQSEGDADEQIFGVKTLSQTEELATVWAPFTVVYKGKMVGCGVNQFTLVNTNDGWKFVYGIDKPEKDGCETYREKFEK